ncbi:MAG: hypothetical protein IJ428_04710 [Clostridia bacterium]|nr:hypothetical protein [Clostridia bacterium]
MNKHRFLSALLALLMLSATAVGCGSDTGVNDPATETADGNTTDEAVETSVLDTLDYGNETFTIRMSNSILSSHEMMVGPEEAKGDEIDIATYNRNMEVEERLGVKFAYEYTDNNWDTVAASARQYIMSGEDTFDLIVDDQLGLSTVAAEGLFVNALDCKYFDFDEDCWWYDYMKEISVGNDEIYMLVGDYFINVLDRAFVIYTNMDILNDAVGMTKEELYQTVLDGNWTYDKFNELITKAYNDENGNTVRDSDDRYGLLISNKAGSMISFVYSSDIQFITRDEDGYPELSMNGERAQQVFEKLRTITTNESTRFNNVGMDTSDQTTMFMNGQGLFVVDSCFADFKKLRDMKYDLGLVPYPKVDENQESYNTTMWDVSEVGVIPTTAKDPDMSSAVVQALCEASKEILIPAYYETALKVKYTRDDITARVIDLIYDNINGSFPLVYNNRSANGIFLDSITKPLQNGGDGIASAYAELEPGAITQLQELVDLYKDREQ